tara:strand:- start:49785 stop:50132 length:348 start_codon:yes stop_codon:yes gene_type:complete
MGDFNEKIVKWVTLDNQMNRLRDDMRELRQEKNELKNEIYTFAEQNELDRAVIKISDGQLKFQQIKQSNPLTFKYIKKCLDECLNNEKQIDYIMNYIKEKREFKTSYDIKRSFNK